MVDLSNVERLAFDSLAYTYAFNRTENELLSGEINAWFTQQLQQYDPCCLAEISISLTVAAHFEVPSYLTPQMGHVFIMVFGHEENERVSTHVSELFLRISETGKIVEVFLFRPTVH